MINSDIYNIALHTSGLTVGPMPVLEFLDKFLPNVEGSLGKMGRGILSHLPASRDNKAFVSHIHITVYHNAILIISRRSKPRVPYAQVLTLSLSTLA